MLSDQQRYLIRRTREVLEAHDANLPYPWDDVGHKPRKYDAAEYLGGLLYLARNLVIEMENQDA